MHSRASNKTQRELIAEAVNHRYWAIVGASESRHKFGHIIYCDLKRAGYNVVGINPNAETADGDRVYPTIGSLPEIPIVVDVVVPSWIGRRIAQDAAAAGVTYFWLQPGAESSALIDYAQSLGLAVIHHACAMVEKRRWTA